MPFLPLLAGLWGNPLSRLIIIGVAAFGFGFLKGFQAVPRVDVAAIERNAISGRDAYWQQQINEANEHHEQRIAEALEAAQSEPVASADRAERMQQCRTDSACRERENRR